MKIWYMNGAGNSFAVIDARGLNIDMSESAKKLCQKQNCDGFMALDNSKIADIKLHFYNRDGSRADMCGNGARCICRFAYDNGIVGEEMTVETDAGIVEGKRLNDNYYCIKLNTPKCAKLDIAPCVDYVVVGVPHLVIELDDIDDYTSEALFERAKKLRYEFDANVNFYSVLDRNTVKNLTYERGVEDFTLACGTGSGAVATILALRGEMEDEALTVENQGGDLRVTVAGEWMNPRELFLSGNAEVDLVEEIVKFEEI